MGKHTHAHTLVRSRTRTWIPGQQLVRVPALISLSCRCKLIRFKCTDTRLVSYNKHFRVTQGVTFDLLLFNQLASLDVGPDIVSRIFRRVGNANNTNYQDFFFAW